MVESWKLTSDFHIHLRKCAHAHTQKKWYPPRGRVKGRREKRNEEGLVGMSCLGSLPYILAPLETSALCHPSPSCPTLLEVCGCCYLKSKTLLFLGLHLFMYCCSLVSTFCRYETPFLSLTGLWIPISSGLLMWFPCCYLSPLSYVLTFKDGLNMDVSAYLWFCCLSLIFRRLWASRF